MSLVQMESVRKTNRNGPNTQTVKQRQQQNAEFKSTYSVSVFGVGASASLSLSGYLGMSVMRNVS